jgi:hypothetical protein
VPAQRLRELRVRNEEVSQNADEAPVSPRGGQRRGPGDRARRSGASGKIGGARKQCQPAALVTRDRAAPARVRSEEVSQNADEAPVSPRGDQRQGPGDRARRSVASGKIGGARKQCPPAALVTRDRAAPARVRSEEVSQNADEAPVSPRGGQRRGPGDRARRSGASGKIGGARKQCPIAVDFVTAPCTRACRAEFEVVGSLCKPPFLAPHDCCILKTHAVAAHAHYSGSLSQEAAMARTGC